MTNVTKKVRVLRHIPLVGIRAGDIGTYVEIANNAFYEFENMKIWQGTMASWIMMGAAEIYYGPEEATAPKA